MNEGIDATTAAGRLQMAVLAAIAAFERDRIFFFFNETATTEISTSLHTLSLHDALPICTRAVLPRIRHRCAIDSRRARRERSEEHTSELQSRNDISYAVFCLKKKNQKNKTRRHLLLRKKKRK